MVVHSTRVGFDLGARRLDLDLPLRAEVLTMGQAPVVADPAAAIAAALCAPLGTPPLAEIVRAKLAADRGATAVIVISDNTRPVPYTGPAGILWPVLMTLLHGGVPAERITVLVATGTHRPVSEAELAEMVDPRVLASGVRAVNHDCRDTASLRSVGATRRGTKVAVNRAYLDADIRILTGLVESHFMAGASGGRKAVVPGLMGEEGTHVFHGAAILAEPGVQDLQLDGNPCHEEALEGARLAGADFVLNVTLDRGFRLTGVFGGELDAAHRAAVAHLTSYAGITLEEPFDIVLTHAGRVGINHYQAAKAGVVGAAATRQGGRLIIAAHHTDVDPVGSARYRTTLHLLKLLGPEGYERLLLSDAWQFVPDQWEPQMWAKVLRRMPAHNLIYCGAGLTARDYEIVPGSDGNLLLAPDRRYGGQGSAGDGGDTLAAMVLAGLEKAVADARAQGITSPRVACLADGPYGIPLGIPLPGRS
jgi:nickel-dependent lactate racemase